MDDLFFFASKLIWAIIVPSNLIVVALVVAAVFRLMGWNALSWVAGFPALLFLAVLARYPISDLIMAPLEATYPVAPQLDKVAGIVVLGGGEDTAMTIAWNKPQMIHAGNRFLTAMELAQAHPEAVVLLTGGNGTRMQGLPSGAEIGAHVLNAGGVDPARLILEGVSDNTEENARLALPMRPVVDGDWVLVTSAFHMRRAVATFCAAGWNRLVPWPGDFKSGRFALGARGDLPRSLRDLNLAAKEYVGLIAYRLTGRAITPDETCLADAAL